MTSTQIRVKEYGEEMEQILDELDRAMQTIYECYAKIGALGCMEITRPASEEG